MTTIKQDEQIFRPLIKPQHLGRLSRYKTNSTKQFSVIPYSYVPFRCIDGGSADPRNLRSSFMIIPEDKQMLPSIGIPLGIILRPFFITQVHHQYKNVNHLKCKCGGWWNPHTYNVNNKYFCNFCQINLDESLNINQSIATKGTFDVIVDRQPNVFYYILLFEISNATLDKEILQTTFIAIAASIECLNPSIRFCFIGFTEYKLMLFSLGKMDKELQIQTINLDIVDEGFLNQLNHIACGKIDLKNMIDQLMEYFAEQSRKYKIMTQNQNSDSLGETILQIIKCEPQVYKKILIISTHSQHKGKYDIGNRQNKYKEIKLKNRSKEEYRKFKSELYFNSECSFKNLSEQLLQYSKSSLDIFVFPEDFIDLENIKQPVVQSGGSVFLYQNFKKQKTSAFYYNLYRVITRFTVFDVQITCKTSQPISVKSITLLHYQKAKSMIRLNSFSEDQTLTINLFQNHKKFISNRSCIQFIVKYSTSEGRTEKVFNFTFYKSNKQQMNQILAGFDAQAASRVLASNFVRQRHKLRLKIPALQYVKQKLTLTKEFIDLHRYKLAQDKRILDGRYLECFELYLTHMFYNMYKFPCARNLKEQIQIYQEYIFLTSPIQNTSRIVYPRVYQIRNEDLEGQQLKKEVFLTIPCNFDYLEDDCIYIFDKGTKLVLMFNPKYPFQHMDIFGVDTIQEIQHLSYIEPKSIKSSKLSKIIERIREDDRCGCRPLQICITNEKISCYEKQLFIENSYLNTSADDYEDFMINYLSDN